MSDERMPVAVLKRHFVLSFDRRVGRKTIRDRTDVKLEKYVGLPSEDRESWTFWWLSRVITEGKMPLLVEENIAKPQFEQRVAELLQQEREIMLCGMYAKSRFKLGSMSSDG